VTADPGWVWFARVDDQALDRGTVPPLGAAAAGGGGRLVAWPAGRKPVGATVRMSADVVDPSGDAGWVSLVLLPRDRCPIFDDPAVSGALRAVLAGPAPDAVTTFVRDSSHFAGAVTVRRQDPWLLRDDPFARLGTAVVVEVGAGLFGRTAATAGPGIQRYSGKPWPASGF
jgi:hypothetical protein